jgi:plasmid maintenance system antidote protein VapI
MSTLSESIGLYFTMNKLSQRKMAPLMDIDHTALSRFLNGKEVSQDTYVKILRWVLQ